MGFVCQASNVENISAGTVVVKAMLGNIQSRGIKRKLNEEEKHESTNYMDTIQRQSVFNISIYKLSRFRQIADPCLLQSVLICNTLRHIEKELEQDRIDLPCDSTSIAFLPNLDSQAMTLDPLQDSLHLTSTSNLQPSTNSEALKYYIVSSLVATDHSPNANIEYDKYLQELSSNNSGRKTPFIRTAYDRMDTGALYCDENDRLTNLNWSSVLNFTTLGNVTAFLDSNDSYSTCASNHNHLLGELNPSLYTLMPPASSVSSSVKNRVLPSLRLNYFSSPSTINSVNTTSSQTKITGPASTSSNNDEIFGDIDVSLYDFDPLSSLLPSNIKMAPVTAEELMKSVANSSDSMLLCQSGNIQTGAFE